MTLRSMSPPCQYTTLTLRYGDSQDVMCMSNQTAGTSPLSYKSLNVTAVESVHISISFPSNGQVGSGGFITTYLCVVCVLGSGILHVRDVLPIYLVPYHNADVSALFIHPTPAIMGLLL